MKVSVSILIVICIVMNCIAVELDTSIISPNLYVAPYGDDSNPGTETKPFATLEQARKAVREFKKKVPKPITVFVREGTYYLSKPVVFTPDDSGTDLQPITYAAYPGEKPTISGGIKLDVKWEAYRDGIMKCSVPKGIDFDQLFINGKRQIRARFPNFNPEKPLVGQGGYLNVALAGEGKVFYDPEKFTKNRWSKPSEAIIHIYQNHYWYNLQYWIKDMDWDGHAIIFGRGGWQKRNNLSPSSSLFNTDSRFFIENVFEELDMPGEWYLDTEKNILYYKPAQGMELSGAKVEAGVLKRLIEFKGSRQNPVRHINLIGFRFAHTATTYLEKYEPASNGDWGIHRGGAVFFEGAQDCAVENSFFDAVGGNAVFISNHNRRIRVYGNKFTETGDSAVCLVGDTYVDINGKLPCPACGAKGWWDFGPVPKDYPADCVISNNLMHHLGIYGKQTAGVFMAKTIKNTVSHNHIHHVPRASICINDPFWGGHIIEYNDIHDTVLETNDHGSFNSWGRTRYWCVLHAHGLDNPERFVHEPGDVKQDAKFTTIIRNNRIREKVVEEYKLAYGSTNMGITMDDGSTNFHVYNNLVIGAGVQNRDGSYRVIENNIFINPSKGLGYHVGHVNSGDRFARNITTQEEGKTFFWIIQPGNDKWIDDMDYNVYYGTNAFSDSVRSLKEWQRQGRDKHSLMTDPMFVDPANGDYRVKPESPAMKLGFKNFDMNNFGLLPDFPDKWDK